MSLRRRLILIHAAFALFALGAAVATIYAVRLQVRQSALRFETLVDEMQHLDACISDLKTLDVHLHEVTTGMRPLDSAFDDDARGVLVRIRELARYSTVDATSARDTLGRLTDRLEEALERLGHLVHAGALADANRLFKTEIEEVLITRLQAELVGARRAIETGRQRASRVLLDHDSQLLAIASLIGVAGVALVVSGALIVRRRLVQPIEALRHTAQTFAAGHLDYRVELPVHDELGQLADTMNSMAEALQRSQRKYQSLFENLRDTVVVCDRDGVIRECHSGDAMLLGVMPERCAGRNVRDVWPSWRFHGLTWFELIERVLGTSDPLRLSDVWIDVEGRGTLPVDVAAYGVEYADERFAAVVLRDVAERNRLQKTARSADTMEAAVNFARGIAHDFKNLLHSVQVALERIRADASDQDLAARATTASEACHQAVRLSRRLTRFSAADEGDPESLRLGETVGMILDSLDEDLFQGVSVEFQVACEALVYIDRDQLTQIALNLIYNALDAMPAGGRLRVLVDCEAFAHPLADQPARPHGVLTVIDSGCGIDPAALEHAFEPLFSTKPRTNHGPRGMGLAVVYAAVNHAGGFVQLDSTPGEGTAARIFLPLSAATPGR